MKMSLRKARRSRENAQDMAYVNRLEVELRMVLDVTLVMCKLKLKVNCARNHSGATCNQTDTVIQDVLSALSNRL